LINASQLVSAGPRTYLERSKKRRKDWLFWNDDIFSIYSAPFGDNNEISLSLDIEKFIISILGPEDHNEHLVLSGISYPMAYGWMKIKMDSFGLDGELYNDNTPYQLTSYLGTDEDMSVTDQDTFSNLVIYYSNTHHLFKRLQKELEIPNDPIIDPRSLSVVLRLDKEDLEFGFTPGDEDYPEPYYFLKLGQGMEQVLERLNNTAGIWHGKVWKGLVLLASDFLIAEPEREQQRVLDFFTTSHTRLIQD
jgi:hypothetical protein